MTITTTLRRAATSAAGVALFATSITTFAGCGSSNTARAPEKTSVTETDSSNSAPTNSELAPAETALALEDATSKTAPSSSEQDSVVAPAEGLDTKLPPLTDEPINISFESYNFLLEGAGADAMHQLVDEFEAEYPNISVERRKPSSIEDLLAGFQQEIIAGDPPSLAQSLFAMDLLVEDLGANSWDQAVGSDTLDAMFDGSLHGQHPVHPRAVTLGDYQGETYAIPFVFSTPTLFINRTVFEAAGLDPDNPPSTWDEVRTAAQAIADKTDAEGLYTACIGPGSYGWCYQAILRSNGNVPISDDLSTLDFDSSEAVEVAEVFSSLVNDDLHINVSDADAVDLMSRGELGMYLQSAVYTGTLLKAADANGWELDATGLPAFGTKPVVPTNSGSGLVLFASDPAEQRAAWELAKFLTSDHAYTVITSQIGYLPLRTGIVEEPEYLAGWLADHPFLQANLDQLDQLHAWILPPGNNSSQIGSLWLDALNEVIFQDADPQGTLTEAQAAASQLMPRN